MMAGKKLFSRKKYAQKDYTEEMLPATRKALFTDTIKLNWKRFLGYGGIFLLFCIPTHIVSLLQSLLVAELTTDAEMTAQLRLEVLGVKNTMAFAQIPCIVFLSAGLAAFARVIRQYAWEENVFFAHDFKKGFKNNAKQMSLLGMLTGGVYAACVYIGNMALAAEETALKMLYILPIGTAVLLGIPIAAYAAVLISIYQNSFADILKMAFVLTVRKLLKNWLVILACLAMLVCNLIPSFAVNIIFRILYSVFVPCLFFVWYLYALEGIDQYINAYHYPEMVGKGLYKTEE